MPLQEQLKKNAGIWVMVAGVLLIIAQIVYGTSIDATSIVTVVKSKANPLYNTLDLLAYFALLIGLVGWAMHPAFGRGAFAWIRFLLVFVGTLLVFGDVWFESFAVPSSVSMSPTLAVAKPGASLMGGILLGFILFALGWLVMAIHAIVKRYIPIWSGILLAISAIYGMQVLIFPHIAPFAITLIIIGWQLRSKSRQVQTSQSQGA